MRAKLAGMEEEVEDGLEIFALTTMGAYWKRRWNLSRGGGDFLKTLIKDDL